MRVILLILLLVSGVSLQATERQMWADMAKDCDGELTGHARSVDLATAVSLLNYKAASVEATSQEVLDLTSQNLNQSVLARIRLIKSLYDHAGEIESARFFLAHLSELESLPKRLITEPESFDDKDHERDLMRAKLNLYTMAKEAFALTFLKLANKHPFLILTQPEVIPTLGAVLFSDAMPAAPSPLLPDQVAYLEDLKEISVRTSTELQALTSGTKMRLSTISLASQLRWEETLKHLNTSPDRETVLGDFARHFRLEFSPNHTPRESSASN